MCYPRTDRRVVLAAIFLCLFSATASAQTVTLAWDPNPNASGYVVRWGPVQGSYPESADSGNSTSFELTGLVPGIPYWVVVQAYNTAVVSSYSAPLQFEVRVPAPTGPVRDMNQDGRPDLIWQHITQGYVAAWTMAGDRMISSILTNPGRVPDTNWRIVGSGDFNGDTKPDLVWQHITDRWLAVWLMDGANVLDSASITPAKVSDTNWQIATIADLDGDGKSDIVWQEKTEGWVGAWLMNGVNLKQSVSLSVERVPDTQWVIKGAGDMDGNGKQDLIWQHGTDGYLAIWYMDGVRVLDSVLMTPTRVTDNDWQIVGVADSNNDGKPDLYWRDRKNGYLGLWVMDGRNLIRSLSLQPEREADANWRIVAVR